MTDYDFLLIISELNFPGVTKEIINYKIYSLISKLLTQVDSMIFQFILRSPFQTDIES